MRRWHWLWLAPLAALGLAANLPASWLDARLAAASDGYWRLAAAEGTLWNGDGQLMFQDRDGTVLAMSRLSWRWQAAALTAGRLGWTLRSDGEAGSVALSLAGLHAERLRLSLPVAALANLSPKWRAARLGGELQLQVETAQLGRAQWQGAARLQWLGASSPLTRLQPFGSYALDAVAEGGSVNLRMGTLAGPLQIDGSGQWQPGAAPQFGGSASSPPEQFEQLKPVLLMLGQPSGPHSISWQLR